MDRFSRSARPEAAAHGLAPPPLRLLQPWPAPPRQGPAPAAAEVGGRAPRGWARRLLDLLLLGEAAR